MARLLHNPIVAANDIRRMIHLQRFPLQSSTTVREDSQVDMQRGTASKRRFRSPDEAAMNAEASAITKTKERLSSHQRREFGGFILRDAAGKYSFTVPITFEAEGKFFPQKETAPKGFTVVAEYHTHPHVTSAEGQGFSTQDGNHYQAYRIAGYVADTYSRKVYRFVPGHTVNRNAWEGTIGDFVADLP